MINFFNSSKRRTSFVIDTSVLAYDYEFIKKFEDADIFIPLEVLEELDNLKTKRNKVGYNARSFIKYLDKLKENGSIFDGIKDGTNVVHVHTTSNLELLPDGFRDMTDNRIIAVAKELQNDKKDVKVLSRDVSLRIKAESVGISSEGFDNDRVDKENYFYNGVVEIDVAPLEIDTFFEKGEVDLVLDEPLFVNQGVVMRSANSSAVAVASGPYSVRNLRFAGAKSFNVEGIYPRNKEQLFALELLLDPDINMVSLTGMSGCGKTLLAIASAMHMLHNDKKTYKKIMLARPTHSVSKDIGFLPGDKKEKLEPWVQPIFDNLKLILKNKGKEYINLMMDRGIIEVEALTYIRGRTLPNTIFIVDEAQNLTHHEAKAILTRMGEDSKLILIGDIEQIDSKNIDGSNSGLSSVVDLFREFEGSGHIRLIKGERSALASYAAKVM